MFIREMIFILVNETPIQRRNDLITGVSLAPAFSSRHCFYDVLKKAKTVQHIRQRSGSL